MEPGAPQEEPADRAGDRAVRALRVALAILAVGFFAAFGLGVWQLWLAWQTSQEAYWQQFWVTLAVVLGLTILWVIASVAGPLLLQIRPLVRSTRSRSERLVQAIIAGDERVGPLAAEQPTPLASSELPIGPVEFGPFEDAQRPQRRSRRVSVAINLFLVVLAAGFIAFSEWSVRYLTDISSFADSFGVPFRLAEGMLGLLGVMGLIGVGVDLWRVLRRRGGQAGPPVLVADDWGIRQRGARREKEEPPIAWHEVRAFYIAADRLRLAGTQVVEGPAQRTSYILHTGERKIEWTISKDTRQTALAEHERLCRLIVTRTGLPLRDASAQIIALWRPWLDLLLAFATLRKPRQSSQQPAATAPSDMPAEGGMGVSANPAHARRPRPRWLSVTRIAMIVLASALFFGGEGARIYRTTQYEDLINRIDREPPLYEIDFRSNDGRWPVHPATATDGSYSYAPDGYYMTGAPAGQPMEAVLPDVYSDATVELTAGLAGNGASGDIGVVLRESADGADKVVFSVSASGGWVLKRYHSDSAGAGHWSILLSNDHSDVVRTGPGAYNWMAVIVRGGDYTCLVRDQVVGIYHDDQQLTPRAGHVGLWLGNSNAVGQFYYFTVYPAV